MKSFLAREVLKLGHRMMRIIQKKTSKPKEAIDLKITNTTEFRISSTYYQVCFP